MSNLSQSDLILAGRFVDGDLDAHEAAQAEGRMAKDSDFAAAVGQIREQSSLLGRLPKFKPSDDLADRTLQASMDQVKAIMGAWPIESDGEKTSVSPKAVEKSFDWKSTAALITSLAGVFMIGAMLWQTRDAESNMAMSEAPLMPTKSATMDQAVAAEMEQVPQPSFAAGMQEQVESVAKSDQMFREEDQIFSKSAPQQTAQKTAPQIASSNAIPGRDMALSGTPMTPAPVAPRQVQNAELTNTSPVSQVWYVSQDSTASKSYVCDILNQSKIAVQREETPQTDQAADPVEAFYVAATPKQMKLAMSQISNNADIEMIEIPSGANSPIADAIQQQFTQSFAVPQANAGAALDNSPPNFQRSQALGQQLVSNSLPRGLSGPVPPILESGSPIEGLHDAPNPSDLASGARTRKSSAAPTSNTDGAGPGEMDEESADAEVDAVANIAMADAATNLKQRSQQAGLDKFLDDSEQLQQYLILVRGGEKKTNNAK